MTGQIVIDAVALDKLTSVHIAQMHVDTIWRRGDPGEMELVLQFFHLLSARRQTLDVDELSARRDDFEAQLKLVFDESGT